MAGTIGRRDFVGGVVSAIVAGGCTTLSAPSAAPKGEGGMFVYVGCYTTKQRNARGEGINVYSMDRTSGIWTHVQLVKDLVNPSWLALDQQQRVLYSDRKSTRLNSSHTVISYAVFCLKKKRKNH